MRAPKTSGDDGHVCTRDDARARVGVDVVIRRGVGAETSGASSALGGGWGNRSDDDDVDDDDDDEGEGGGTAG